VGESRLVNRNVTSAAGRTSIRLEPELWDALGEICRREKMSLTDAIRAIERGWRGSGQSGGRTSAVRVHIVTYFRAAATEHGHAAAKHGTMIENETSRPTRPDGDSAMAQPLQI